MSLSARLSVAQFSAVVWRSTRCSRKRTWDRGQQREVNFQKCAPKGKPVLQATCTKCGGSQHPKCCYDNPNENHWGHECKGHVLLLGIQILLNRAIVIVLLRVSAILVLRSPMNVVMQAIWYLPNTSCSMMQLYISIFDSVSFLMVNLSNPSAPVQCSKIKLRHPFLRFWNNNTSTNLQWLD